MGLLEDLLPKFGNHAMILEKSLEAYLATLPEQRSALSTALASENRDDLKKAAHRIKGSLGYFGSDDMVAQCQQIEESSASAPLDELRTKVSELDDRIEKLSHDLQALMADLKA